jgi:hypothetical protein
MPGVERTRRGWPAAAIVLHEFLHAFRELCHKLTPSEAAVPNLLSFMTGASRTEFQSAQELRVLIEAHCSSIRNFVKKCRLHEFLHGNVFSPIPARENYFSGTTGLWWRGQYGESD